MPTLFKKAMGGLVGLISSGSPENYGKFIQQERAYKENLEMWNRQNVYNAPVNQMARYKEAGLNPNLMYGQGSSGNATQLPKYMAPEYSMKMPEILNMLGQYQQLRVAGEQEKNISADTGVKIQERAIKMIDEQVRILEHGIKFQEELWKNTMVKDPVSGRLISKYQLSKNQIMEMEKQRMLLQTEYTQKAITFNKYMDFSQIGGIAGKFLPFIMDAIKLMIMKGKK